MKLESTIELMVSDDHKDRFKAEYYQTKIRYERLKHMCTAYEVGMLDFDPTCPYELLMDQVHIMAEYLHILESRAILENVDL